MRVALINETARPQDAIRSAMNVTRGSTNDNYEDDAKRFLALAKLHHWSPFEHANFTFELNGISRVTQQQLTRHRMASFSIESQRSVRVGDDPDEVYVAPDTVSKHEMGLVWNNAIAAVTDAYRTMIKNGVPMEDARYILPGATIGRIIVTMNARELYHFFNLRLAPGAQWEIRKLAGQMFTMLHNAWPDIFNEEIMKYAE